jgi:hypothetical protein
MAIKCATHGESEEAFICEHLMLVPAQYWCSGEPTSSEPSPDAWCTVCDQHFQAEGEWNEHNEGKVPIKLVCQGCYKHLRLSELRS